jgi:hypothetical protein
MLSELLTTYIQLIFGVVSFVCFVAFLVTGRKKQFLLRLGVGCLMTTFIAQVI